MIGICSCAACFYLCYYHASLEFDKTCMTKHACTPSGRCSQNMWTQESSVETTFRMCTSAHSYHSAISWDVCTKLNHLAHDPFELLSFVSLALARSLNHTNSTATQSCQICAPARRSWPAKTRNANEHNELKTQIESNRIKYKEDQRSVDDNSIQFVQFGQGMAMHQVFTQAQTLWNSSLVFPDLPISRITGTFVECSYAFFWRASSSAIVFTLQFESNCVNQESEKRAWKTGGFGVEVSEKPCF